MNKKILILVLVIFICFTFTGSYSYGATEPTLVRKLNTALNSIKNWLVKLSLPAAAVAIATGVLIRKFSFGNEEKLVIGRKVIVNAILRLCYYIGNRSYTKNYRNVSIKYEYRQYN